MAGLGASGRLPVSNREFHCSAKAGLLPLLLAVMTALTDSNLWERARASTMRETGVRGQTVGLTARAAALSSALARVQA